MQIQNLNAWIDVARAEIVGKYQPEENDRTTYLLQAAHVDEGEYFTSRVHRDIDAIMEDMREAHQARITQKSELPKGSVSQKGKKRKINHENCFPKKDFTRTVSVYPICYNKYN